MFSNEQKRLILQFYMQARADVLKTTRRSNIGLRNLSRALKMMRSAIKLKYPVIKAIYDALYTCFASHLDSELQQSLHSMIYELFEITQLPTLDMMARQQSDLNAEKYAYVE